MLEELEVLKEVAEKLNNAGIPYIISGSVAMNFYAEPRMTRDIDIVVALREIDIDKFVALFKDDFYIEEDTVKTEVRARGMFNLIHNKYIIKIDFILQKGNELDKLAFERRKMEDLDGVSLAIISPEDLVLHKLNWAKESESEMQDTSPAIQKKMTEMLKQKSGIERIKMGMSMFDMAKKLVLLSLPSQEDSERRIHVFLRFYGNDFDEQKKQKIIQYIRSAKR